YRTEISGMAGDGRLERIEWTDRAAGEAAKLEIRHVFVMAGAAPRTVWVRGGGARDATGCIATRGRPRRRAATARAAAHGRARAATWGAASRRRTSTRRSTSTRAIIRSCGLWSVERPGSGATRTKRSRETSSVASSFRCRRELDDARLR